MTDAVQAPRTRPWYKGPLVWLGCVVVAALAVYGVIEMGGKPATIRYSDFLDQLDAGNIASVTFAGTQIDGRFKQPVAESAATNGAPLTVFRSRVPEFGDTTLLPELRQKHVAIAVAPSSQWLGLGGTAVLGGLAAVLLAKPMLLLIIVGGFVAGLIRVMRGGEMNIRSILSMVPMFRSVSPGQSGERSAGDAPRTGDR